MKIKEGFLLREIAGNPVVVPTGIQTVNLNGMITLSQTGALLWRELEKGADQKDLVDAMLNEYDIDRETASEDITAFLDKLKNAGILEV